MVFLLSPPAVGHGSPAGSHHLCVFVGMDSSEKKNGKLNSIAVSYTHQSKIHAKSDYIVPQQRTII